MTGLRERSEPAARQRRRVWPFLLVLALLAAIGIGGAYVVYGTSVIGVRTVAVSGVTGAAADQVRQAAAVPPGAALAAVDLPAVQRRVQAVPAVAGAQVSRIWPHTLHITVQLRTPVAATQANGQWWLLDSTGKPYQTVPSAPSGMVTIELATPAADDPATMAALTVVKALTPAFAKTVKAVKAPSPYGISLILADGRTVIWGDAAESELKMRVLPAVLEQPGRVYDVTDPKLVTVR